ncbi:helix-turn-helix domain-containing protein [Streptomyces sp. AC555_RSS877]|uniref:helix-turn-helix domain-containing protein n=1 Tax=Streptomyces sp. AC555_RSS877 TaxID=2823688 RepID=UPI0035ABFAFC
MTAQVRQVLRAKIVLAAADGLANAAIARELKVSINTVRKWRGRFAAGGRQLCLTRNAPAGPVSTGRRCASP